MKISELFSNFHSSFSVVRLCDEKGSFYKDIAIQQGTSDCNEWNIRHHNFLIRFGNLPISLWHYYNSDNSIIIRIQETKKEHNANDDWKSEVKQKIEMIKQGKLPPIPSVDNQSTKGLVTRNKKEDK